ncbi:MAG TPA: Gp138 family membrane-puncturing spike protein [Defluviitaleaceae bacterium]|nr:Gp138 family membrane-puncturing spike protein [Defluviitaleaceae bacterium]
MNDTATFNQFADSLKNEIRVAIPAEIINFDPNNLTVNVKILIQGIRIKKNGKLIQLETGERVTVENYELAPLQKVPIALMWWQNFGITLPILPGMQGTLLVCDRNISLFKQSQTSSPVASLRRFDLNDAVFLPFLPKKASVSDYSSDSIDIRYATTKLKVSASGVDITGNLNVSGDTKIGGEAIVSNIPFTQHIHPYLNGTTPSQTGTPEV